MRSHAAAAVVGAAFAAASSAAASAPFSAGGFEDGRGPFFLDPSREHRPRNSVSRQWSWSSSSPASSSLSSSSSEPPLRRLEDNAGNSYQYLNDLSGLNLSYDQCIRVKIPQENDDDGNQYFYNNRYHAPSIAYASFHLCDKDGDNNKDQCGACDLGTAYVVELETFLEAQVEYVQGYCNACQNQCRRRRRAEDEDENENEGGGNAANYGENICDACVDQCSLLLAGNEGNDETNYLECQQAHQDENGLQYYSGPACNPDTGGITIGLYYDEDCTLKSQAYDNNFAYNTFGTIEAACTDCSSGACADLYGDSSHCVDGRDMLNGGGGDDDDEADMPICKTYAKISKEWTYAKARSANKFVPVIMFVVIVGALGLCCSFLSYTYYVRHAKGQAAKAAVPMASLDGEVGDAADGKDSPANNMPPLT